MNVIVLFFLLGNSTQTPLLLELTLFLPIYTHLGRMKAPGSMLRVIE